MARRNRALILLVFFICYGIAAFGDGLDDGRGADQGVDDEGTLAGHRRNVTDGPRAQPAGFSQTETCLRLSLVNGSRFQPPQRSRSVIPASRAIRSSSDGHT